MTIKIVVGNKGSIFSGFHGHAGRHGKVGGSAPASNKMAVPADSGQQTVQAKYHDLESMPTYDKYMKGETNVRDESGQEDLYLKSIIHDQGFDGLPDVRSEADMDAFVANGEVEIFRGLTPRYEGGSEPIRGKFTKPFKSGELFVGRGIHGNGTYVSTDKSEAAGYAGPEGDVMRMTLKKDAKVIGDSDIYNLRHQTRDRLDREFDPTMDAYQAGKMGKEEFVQALESHYARVTKMEQSPMWTDPSRVAAILGYDAIKIGGLDSKMYVILNRTALRVQDTDLKGSE